MPLYMTVTKYSEESLQALAEHPSDRPQQVAKVIESFGGRLKDFYWIFGDDDVVMIYEAPNNQSVFSILLTLSHSGALASQKTYPLLSNDDAMGAMGRVGDTKTGYLSPVKEWEGWRDEGGMG